MMTTSCNRAAGVTLIAISLLAVFAMAHHPTIGSDTFEGALAEIQRERWINSLVHGVMIVIVGLYCWGFSVLGRWLGHTSVSADLAGLAFNAGSLLMVGAAIVSGFITPDFAASASSLPDAEAAIRVSFRLLFATNQSLAILASVAYGLALIGWGIAFLSLAIRGARVLAALGLAAGAAIIAALVHGGGSLGVHLMTVIVIVLGVWACAVGAMLMRRAGTVD